MIIKDTIGKSEYGKIIKSDEEITVTMLFEYQKLIANIKCILNGNIKTNEDKVKTLISFIKIREKEILK